MLALAPSRARAPPRVPPLRSRARAPPARRTPRSSSSTNAPSSSRDDDDPPYPVLRLMQGTWTDSVRYVDATLTETPLRLRGTRTIALADDGTVELRSSTTFPGGKVLDLRFVGERVAAAEGGLKDVVRFRRVPLEPDDEGSSDAASETYFPIVLLASEHPARPGEDDHDALIVREVLAESGRVLLSETVHLVKDEAGGVTEAAHAAQEVAEDGSLGGVQLWRSRKEP